MQFVADGPDVPEELLQAHEEGRVVFFAEQEFPTPLGCPVSRDLLTRSTQ